MAVSCSGLSIRIERRTAMNNVSSSFIAICFVILFMLAVFAVLKLPRFRHAFLVPEGYAGLLYHKGKFAEILRAGRHIRWGRHFTLNAYDLRRMSLLVPGQDVL